ncbi:MAG TPA: glycosyltransferase family 87 protein [Acidobacteriota bacterium]|jgi:hypothetical protein
MARARLLVNALPDLFTGIRSEYLPFLLLCAAVLALCLVSPLWRLGDSSDYILTTESLWYDHDLEYSGGDLARHLKLKPPTLDTPAGLETPTGKDGKKYLGMWHSFYYSLAAVPFYLLFRYRGFYLFNGFLFCLMTLCLYRHLRRSNETSPAWSWSLLAVGFSASWSYIIWMHPEVFYMALMGFFIFFWIRGRLIVAGAMLGLAAGAQPTLGALLAPFVLLEIGKNRNWKRVILATAVCLLLAAPQYLVNWIHFGIIHPMLATQWVGPSNISFGRWMRSLFDPAAGLIWFYPAVVPALLESPKNRFTLAVSSTAALVLLATGSSSIWYSHQIGLRYGSYVFPLFLFLPRSVSFQNWRAITAWCFVVLAGTGLVVNPIGNSATLNIDTKLFLPYRVARKLPWYREEGVITWFRMHPIAPSVGLDAVWADGWIPGGQEVTMILMSVTGGPVELDVRSWSRQMGRDQKFSLKTDSGHMLSFQLEPDKVHPLKIPLGKDDIRRSKEGELGVVVVKLWAEPWSPATTLNTPDNRVLGIQLTRIAAGGFPSRRIGASILQPGTSTVRSISLTTGSRSRSIIKQKRGLARVVQIAATNCTNYANFTNLNNHLVVQVI